MGGGGGRGRGGLALVVVPKAYAHHDMSRNRRPAVSGPSLFLFPSSFDKPPPTIGDA